MRKEVEVKSYLLASGPKGLHPFQRTVTKESNKGFFLPTADWNLCFLGAEPSSHSLDVALFWL